MKRLRQPEAFYNLVHIIYNRHDGVFVSRPVQLLSPPNLSFIHAGDLSLQTRLLVPIRNLKHRTRIMMPTVNEPKQHAKKHNAPKHQDAVVHTLDSWVLLHGPHGPEGPEHRIHDRGDGDRDAETAEAEGAPGDVGVGRPEALVQHDGGGEDEGGVVARNDEGDEGAEADGGADVDKGEEEVDDGCGADGVEGEVGALVDLEMFM